jgi:hypothetical protein
MKPAAAASALRVQAALGPDYQVLEFDAGARTAADAAAAIGCAVAEIAKSLIFRAEPSGRAVLAIVSGDKRVDERKLGEIVGERIVRAAARPRRAADDADRRVAIRLRDDLGGGGDAQRGVPPDARRPPAPDRRDASGDRALKARRGARRTPAAGERGAVVGARPRHENIQPTL